MSGCSGAARRGLGVVAVALGLLALAPAGAHAAIALGVIPSVPSTVSTGDPVAASLTIVNASTGGDAAASRIITAITLVPSCGSQMIAADCAIGVQDPGAIVPSPGGSGRVGTACAGLTFAFALADPAQGKYNVIPNVAAVLGPAASATNTCVIDFTIEASRLPVIDSDIDPGIQTAQRAFASVAGGGGVGTSQTTVARGAPTLSTNASAGVAPGGRLTDTATLSGLATPQPGSTVTFRLYPPADPACAGAAAFTDVQPVALAGNTGTATSLPFTATELGTYRWVAAYSGDLNNLPVAGTCGDPNETRTVAVPVPPPFPAKLEIARARVISSTRRLDVLAPITARASGRVNVSFQAAGRTERFTAPVDSDDGRITINRRIPAAQARLGTGILRLSYPGDADTQPQDVRLRAAAVHADLVAGRPTISAGRLKAAGRISTRARGVVRLQLLYEPAGADTRTLSFSARISGGRYRFDAPLDAAVLAQLAARRGVVHSYTLFTGYAPARMRGEMASFQVLGAP